MGKCLRATAHVDPFYCTCVRHVPNSVETNTRVTWQVKHVKV
jgi:hypothetical protein